MQTQQTQNGFPGPKSYPDFRETGPRSVIPVLIFQLIPIKYICKVWKTLSSRFRASPFICSLLDFSNCYWTYKELLPWDSPIIKDIIYTCIYFDILDFFFTLATRGFFSYASASFGVGRRSTEFRSKAKATGDETALLTWAIPETVPKKFLAPRALLLRFSNASTLGRSL